MSFIFGTCRAKNLAESRRKRKKLGVMAPVKPAFYTSASDIGIAQYLTHITHRHIMDCNPHWDFVNVHDIFCNRTSTTVNDCLAIFSIFADLVNGHYILCNSTSIPVN